jgi:hypothetical protein
MEGFVYVLSNAHLLGLVKIGCSERHPEIRRRELSESSAVPEAFKLEFFVEVTDMEAAEMAVHKFLNDARVSPSREFFRLSTDLAIQAVWKAADAYIPLRAKPREAEAQVRTDSAKKPSVTQCPTCRAPLRFTPLTMPVGGFRSCGTRARPGRPIRRLTASWHCLTRMRNLSRQNGTEAVGRPSLRRCSL